MTTTTPPPGISLANIPAELRKLADEIERVKYDHQDVGQSAARLISGAPGIPNPLLVAYNAAFRAFQAGDESAKAMKQVTGETSELLGRLASVAFRRKRGDTKKDAEWKFESDLRRCAENLEELLAAVGGQAVPVTVGKPSEAPTISAGKVSGYLGLIVDADKRTVRRAGENYTRCTVDLRPKQWPLFMAMLKAEHVGLTTERARMAYTEDPEGNDATKTAVDDMRGRLEILDITIEKNTRKLVEMGR